MTDESIEANVADKPGKADVVADMANVINKIVVANEVIKIKANETNDANNADEAEANDANKAIVADNAIEATELMRLIWLIRILGPTRPMRLIWQTRPVQPTRSNSLRPSRLMQSMLPMRPLLHPIAPAHIFSVAIVFNGATFTCARTFGFSIVTVVKIEGKGKIEQFAVVFSGFYSTTALPFTPSQNIFLVYAKDKGYFGISDP